MKELFFQHNYAHPKPIFLIQQHNTIYFASEGITFWNSRAVVPAETAISRAVGLILITFVIPTCLNMTIFFLVHVGLFRSLSGDIIKEVC